MKSKLSAQMELEKMKEDEEDFPDGGLTDQLL